MVGEQPGSTPVLRNINNEIFPNYSIHTLHTYLVLEFSSNSVFKIQYHALGGLESSYMIPHSISCVHGLNQKLIGIYDISQFFFQCLMAVHMVMTLDGTSAGPTQHEMLLTYSSVQGD